MPIVKKILQSIYIPKLEKLRLESIRSNLICSSSHQRCFVKGVLRNFAEFTGKHLCQSLFFDKVDKVLKKETLTQVFPVNFANF